VTPARKPWRRLVATLLLAVAVAWPACQAAEYGDVPFTRKVDGMDDIPPAVFPHWVHRMQYKCSACHDEPFKMKAGANEVTMDLIQAGKSCGICHNGKTAFESNFDTCLRCHYK
jgi:c(7)-type cytochrome triheme protein